MGLRCGVGVGAEGGRTDEDDARVEEGGEQREGLPLRALEALVRDARGVAGGDAHEYEEEQRGGEQPTAVGGGEEARARAHDGEQRLPSPRRARRRLWRGSARAPEAVVSRPLPPPPRPPPPRPPAGATPARAWRALSRRRRRRAWAAARGHLGPGCGAMSSSCVPVPTLTLSSSEKAGGRSTSACTSFQPLSC